jgi:hypothetical protein
VSRAAYVAYVAFAAFVAGCVDEVPSARAACPCSEGHGHICCPTQVCIPPGEVCPLDPYDLDDPVVEPMIVALGVDQGACRATMDADGTIVRWDLLRSDTGYDLLMRDASGLANRLDQLEVDAAGRVTRMSFGEDVLIREHLQDGRLKRISRTGPTAGRATWEYGYLQDGTWTVEASDHELLGADERRSHRLDASGHDAHVDIRLRNAITGAFEDRIAATLTTTFDGRRRLVRVRDRSQTGDLVTDTFLHDALGRDVGVDRTYDSSALVFHPYVVLYDEQGRVRRREYHHSLPGLDNVSFDYEYSCP